MVHHIVCSEFLIIRTQNDSSLKMCFLSQHMCARHSCAYMQTTSSVPLIIKTAEKSTIIERVRI